MKIHYEDFPDFASLGFFYPKSSSYTDEKILKDFETFLASTVLGCALTAATYAKTDYRGKKEASVAAAIFYERDTDEHQMSDSGWHTDSDGAEDILTLWSTIYPTQIARKGQQHNKSSIISVQPYEVVAFKNTKYVHRADPKGLDCIEREFIRHAASLPVKVKRKKK